MPRKKRPVSHLPWVLNRLKLLARRKSASGNPFACCDRVDQEVLYQVQEDLTRLMLEVAQVLKAEEKLVREFPYLYQTTGEES